ncbi:hypothetical protein KA977_06520 [Candidatus Dependentiae bacterium]|nr:hypothetical protein [Candidatus Dependentiae bacterium]
MKTPSYISESALAAARRPCGQTAAQSDADSCPITDIFIKGKNMVQIIYFFITLFLIFSNSSNASILGMEYKEIIFNQNDTTIDAIWADNLKITQSGLESPKLESLMSIETWIKINKMSAGYAWRPPENSNIRLFIDGIGSETFPLQVYVRFGCDGKHWSTWYKMNIDFNYKFFRKKAKWIFSYELRIPKDKQENEYSKLFSEWGQTDVAWSSDENAFCEYLINKKPDFFRDNFPFIGYLQFLFESSSLKEKIIIKSISIESAYGVGGMHSKPKEGYIPDYNSKWHLNIGK